jgi:hypothetical protein
MRDYTKMSSNDLEKVCFVNANKTYITNVVEDSKKLVKEGKYKEIVSVISVDNTNNVAKV